MKLNVLHARLKKPSLGPMRLNVDPFNYAAIALLEIMGQFKPSEAEIELLESLLKQLLPVTLTSSRLARRTYA